jgi:hypothetical protein
MDKQQARNLIRETFEKPFDKNRFTHFIKNLLNRIEEAPFAYHGQFIPEAYRQYISTLERIGKFNDGENRIDILIVKLQRETSLERARTNQRNFVAGYLQGKYGSSNEKEAALVAFISPNNEDWRFSLVKMDYRFEEGKGGKTKVKEEFTPARRWSFLVGKNENSHTAQSTLVPIMADDRHNPGLAELEQAFNIEKVTKEFFEKYRELFLLTKEKLDELLATDKKVKADFESKSVNTVDFAKKLLGQIVFLYFLQKKGWFGVQRDADWGTGPKNFLRELFESKHGSYKNFFNDILEPLFYEALARERDDDFYSRFNCKIPFLNGGLFDPINNYDWVHTDILLPNELFSNSLKTKEGDIGNGILDIFDRYNFTVKEDEPLEKEVAVDPEMLGKVFENLLEVKDRKSKGTYYTPREIVHYMCRQSLINYLSACHAQAGLATEHVGADGNPPVSREDIETLVKYGEQVGENEARVENAGRETNTYFYKLPESIRQNAQLIDEKLANIKVCDPAIGSGAFPVGMMSEIVKTRNVLSVFIKDKDRTIYNFKRKCIEKSLYGVDIDPGAVEIAKLRLWLSLVVDEDDIKQIKPLPNLDYKIVCGNSLLGVEKDLLNAHLFNELETLKPLLFNETNPKKKQEYKKQIDELINRITKGHKEFDFEIYFSEVFHEKGGFDVVIANPPYISHDKIKNKNAIKNAYASYEPFADIYCYFLELALKLQTTNGLLCFITSNSYLRTEYGAPIRKYLKDNNYLLDLVNIEDAQVFDNAIVNVAVILSSKSKSYADYLCRIVNSQFVGDISFEEFIQKKSCFYSQKEFNAKSWNLIEPHILELQRKIESKGKTLEELGAKIRLGLATGNNDAFIIDEQKKNEFYRSNQKNGKIIKPILRGRDIFRYSYTLQGFYMLLTKNGVDVKSEYPDVYKHLESFGEKFKSRGAQGTHWTNLRACSFFDDFKKEKIIWIELTDIGRFALCMDEIYLLNSAYFLLPPRDYPAKYLLGILNSTVIRFYLNLIAETSGMGTNRWINNYVKKFPIPEASINNQKTLISLVDQVLACKQKKTHADTSTLEREIDQMVYKLYDLTPEEIKIVEGGSRR